MNDFVAYSTLEALLDDVRTRFLQAKKQGVSCSLKVSNATGIFTLLLDEPDPEETEKLIESLRLAGGST